MIIPFAGPEFVARFGNNVFNNLLNQNESSNTDRFRIGSTPINSSGTSVKNIPDPGKTDNPTQSYNTSGKGAGSNAVTALSKGQSAESVAESGHSNDQWTGRSLRSPMGSGEGADQNSSKNIFFTFRNDSSTPAIWMWINPGQLTISHSKKIAESMTRGGFVMFHWGDALDEISASGISGSFARMDTQGSRSPKASSYSATPPDVGLDRRSTIPYYRFMQLLALYRNNGISIPEKSNTNTGGFPNSSQTVSSAESMQSSGPATNKEGILNKMQSSGGLEANRSGTPVFVGIEMHYDDNIFTGYFTSFTWNERAEEPYKFSFDFRFTVLDTTYNQVFETIRPSYISGGMLANFQNPRFNSL